MWDWRQKKWLNWYGWWPQIVKDPFKRRLWRIFGILLYVFDFIQLIPEWIAVWVHYMEGSMKGAVLNLNTAIYGTLCAGSVRFVTVNQERLTTLINKIDDLENRAKEALGDEIDKMCGWHFKVTWLAASFAKFAIFLASDWLIRPLLHCFHGEYLTIMDSWTPWSQKTLSGFIVTYIIQIVHIFSALSAKFFLDSLIFALCEMTLCNFEILKFALKSLDFTRKDQKADIMFCIKFHSDLMWICKEINDILWVLQQSQCLSSGFVICLSIYEASDMHNIPFHRVVNLIELTIMGVGILFFNCIQCHRITEQCTHVLREAYMNNWYLGSQEHQHDLMILMERAKKPQIFGSIIEINLSTFITVLKTAFSYYNVLKAFEL